MNVYTVAGSACVFILYLQLSSPGDTVMYGTNSHRMSDDQVARMMGLDTDDQPTSSGLSRLRERASSSSSSSSDEDSVEEKATKSKKSQHSKGKIRKNASRSSVSSGLSHFNSSGSEGEIQVVDTSKHSKGKSSSGSRGSGKASAAQLEPVGIFWDIENCVVPPGRSAFHLVQKFRQYFVEGKREVEFMCVCDTLKETGEVITDLNKAHVSI